ncbi:aquIMA, partial [Symbiodinium sp. CCMP2456]
MALASPPDPSRSLAAAGMPRSTLYGLPTRGEASFKDEAWKAGQFLEKLRAVLSSYPPGSVVFSQVDVSKVIWSASGLDVLFGIFRDRGVRVDRLRAFDCGLDDDAARSIAAWLHGMSATHLPSEMHLSHNRLTVAGFRAVVEAIEIKWAQLMGKRLPVWLRVEGNAVDDFNICALVASGRAVLAASCKAPERWNGGAALSFPAFHGKNMSQMDLEMHRQQRTQAPPPLHEQKLRPEASATYPGRSRRSKWDVGPADRSRSPRRE